MQAVVLPGRGHDIALRPVVASGSRSRAVPADSALRCRSIIASRLVSAARPAFLRSRRLLGRWEILYATEYDYDNALGVIGVRDATGGYMQIGELDAHGMEPHDIALLSDGRTMVIANGGIRTHPDSGAKSSTSPTCNRRSSM